MAKINLKIKYKKNGKDSIGRQEYPSIYLSDVELPLTKAGIGKLVKAKVTLKFTGYREDNSTDKNHVSYDFAIHDIEFEDSAVNAVKSIMNKRNK
jgi:hypothetical protein